MSTPFEKYKYALNTIKNIIDDDYNPNGWSDRIFMEQKIAEIDSIIKNINNESSEVSPPKETKKYRILREDEIPPKPKAIILKEGEFPVEYI